MRGASRTITIIILVVLMVVLAALAFLVLRSQQGGQGTVAIPGQDCSQGAAAQCQLNDKGNTGFMCNCRNSGNGFKWDCSEQNLTTCPLPSGVQQCTAGQVQTGDCGASGCAANQRPVQQCQTNGTFGQVSCSTDATCVGGSTSSGSSTSSSVTSSVTTSAAACIIVNPAQTNSYIEISSTCDAGFSYQVEKYTQTVAANTPHTACLDIDSTQQPQTLTGTPGSTYDFDNELCGQCVLYKLLAAPAGSQPSTGPFTVAAFTGNCSVATSTSSSVSSSSSSNGGQPLPDTGLFDGDANALLAGLTLLLAGVLVNRVWGVYYHTANAAREAKFESQVLDRKSSR